MVLVCVFVVSSLVADAVVVTVVDIVVGVIVCGEFGIEMTMASPVAIPSESGGIVSLGVVTTLLTTGLGVVCM